MDSRKPIACPKVLAAKGEIDASQTSDWRDGTLVGPGFGSKLVFTRAHLAIQALHEKNRDLETHLAKLQTAYDTCETESLQVEMASQAKSDLLSALSQKLRTPLSDIIGLWIFRIFPKD